MKRNLVASSALSATLLCVATAAPAADQRVFELRIYTAEQGKLEALHRRFREHTIGLFEKHGMTVVGFWTPSEGEKAHNTLVYLLTYPSREARDSAWQAFVQDPEWQRVYADSRKDGPLVKEIDSTIMEPTDYSPLE